MQNGIPQQIADAPPEQRDPRELVQMIRKLRWMGLEDEERQLVSELNTNCLVECVIGDPRDTD